MRKIILALLMLIPTSVLAQFSPPPSAAYSFDTGTWAPISGTGSVGALSFSPPPIALYCQNGSGQWIAWTTAGCGGGGGGGGTVTSVALTMPVWLAVAGSPITTSGTLAVTPATGQTSHQVIGTCGSATTFGPCNLVAGDIPTSIPIANIGTAGLSGTSPITISTAGAIACATCVVASSPSVGIAHFAGSTQTVTSSAVNLASADVTGNLPAASVASGALASGMTATTQSANDNSTKLATTAYVDGKTTSTPVPATVGGLEYWFSADRAPGSNSTAFTRWPDPTDAQWVTMISPSQAGATYVTGAVNGQPAISFPGTTATEFLFGSNALPRVVSTSTTFVVFNTSTVSGNHMFIDGPSNALNVLLSGTHLQLAQANVATIGTDSTTLSASTWYQANSTYNSGTGAFAFRVNEIAGASGTQTSTISVQQSAIGYDPTGVGSFFNGSIAEIIVYNRVLSGGEITTIETYLHTKYGI